MNSRFIYTISFLLFFRIGFSQHFNETDFIRYTTKNGLNDNYITGLEQDDLGNIWIASETGLNWFDGFAFGNHANAITGATISNVSKLKKIARDKIAVISISGVYLLDTKDFTYKKYGIADSSAFTSYLNYTWDAALLADQSIAVTSSTGFYVFDKEGKIKFRYDAYKPEDVGKKTIRYGRDIFSLNNHEFLVYFNIYGTAVYDLVKNQYRIIDPSEPEWSFFSLPPKPDANHWITKFQLSPNEFIFIHAASDTIVYYDHRTKKEVKSLLPFHTKEEIDYQSKIVMLSDTSFILNSGSGGLWMFHFDGRTGKITSDGKKYLSSHKINCLFVDKEKRIWLGTSEGLLQQRLIPPILQVTTLTPEILHDPDLKDLTCVYRYKDKLYVGRYARRSGLVILDAESMKLISTINLFEDNSAFNEINSIEMYHRDTLWLGSNSGLIWFDTKTNKYGKLSDNKKFPDVVTKLRLLSPVGKDGYAWMSAYLQGLVARYDPSTGNFQIISTSSTSAVPFTRIKKIFRDAYGDVWISGHGLARWNNELQNFDTLITVYAGPKKFNDNILAVTADKNGSIWFHNVENGLLEYKIRQKKFLFYGKDEGLPFDNIESLGPVIDNSIWIAQRNSISRFDIETKKTRSYSYYDGMPLHKPTSSTIYFDTISGLCYLPCKNDLVSFAFFPKEKPESSSELIFQKIVVNDRKMFFNSGGGLSFKPGENNLTIQFTVIDFETANDYNFAYRLGNSGSWINLGKQRVITLVNLNPGSHKLEVKAIGRSGMEKIGELNFFISPPFWKTTWFIVLVIIAAVALLYMFYRNRIRQIRQKSDVDKLLAKTEMKALHAQMNPHFIFNCLNSIREMILNNENQQASHYLSKFAQLIRATLDQSSKPFVSLQTTIDYLKQYLEMERIRNSNFIYRIEVDDDLEPEQITLPPMLIQPFIENAIWHGAVPRAVPMNLNIRFNRDGDQLLCIVEDDGIGIETSVKNKIGMQPTHRSLGIENVRQRIQVLNEKYKMKSNLVIRDKSQVNGHDGTGTVVTLNFPVKNMED